MPDPQKLENADCLRTYAWPQGAPFRVFTDDDNKRPRRPGDLCSPSLRSYSQRWTCDVGPPFAVLCCSALAQTHNTNKLSGFLDCGSARVEARKSVRSLSPWLSWRAFLSARKAGKRNTSQSSLSRLTCQRLLLEPDQNCLRTTRDVSRVCNGLLLPLPQWSCSATLRQETGALRAVWQARGF